MAPVGLERLSPRSLAKCLLWADISVPEAAFRRQPWIGLGLGRGSANFRKRKMAGEDQQGKSLVAQAAWPLLVLTAVLQLYLGLSAVAYPFLGVPTPASGVALWTTATMGGLDAVAAVVALRLAVRRDLRSTTLAVAGSIMLGWLSTLPSVYEQGLDFYSDSKLTPVYFAAPPIVAIAAATLAWRNVYPIAAALIVSAMTFVGILFVIAFAFVIAIYGF